MSKTTTISIGPLAISKYRWKKFREIINQAFIEWRAWSGGQGDLESQDQFKSMIDKDKAWVDGILTELEKGVK